jgi:hypothetical protein
MFGDHIHFGNGKGAISSGGIGPTRSDYGEGYVVSHMCLEINTVGSDFENVAGLVFHHGVIAIRTTQATLNGGLIWSAARWGSLCKPQRDQQGRYNYQQQCSLHGNPPRFSPGAV